MDTKKLDIKIITFKGLSDVLLEELKELGVYNARVKKGVVFVRGDLELLYRLNLSLRTALKILVTIKKFKIETADDIYKHAKHIKWESIFGVDKSFKIETVGFSLFYNNLNYASLKVKDAIVDRFRDNYDERPSVEKRDANIHVHVHVKEKIVEISLNASGVSLHQRGYRISGHRAPVNEVVAAAIIRMSKWDKKSEFWDLMCGTGTLLIEAIHYALNIPPRKLNREYSFMNWMNFDSKLFKDLKKELESKIDFDKKLSLYGNDISEKSIEITRKSLEKLKLSQYVTLSQGDYKECDAQSEEGVIIINPPYGKRLNDGNVEVLYREIGYHVKHHFKGYEFWILSSNLKAIRKLGMKPSEIYELYNGGIEVRFQHYSIRRVREITK